MQKKSTVLLSKMLFCVALILVILVFFACHHKDEIIIETDEFERLMEEAVTTPFGKYPEEITYTLGKVAGTNRSNMPDEDDYENNFYTRYLNEMLNIQNVNVFEEEGNHYDNIVTMSISERNIPDVMIVKDLNTLKALVKNDMIEDLTETYELCASDMIKDMYGSYGDRLFDLVTFDHKLMAIPGVNIEYGPNLLWLRKDWMDLLGLDDPETLDDVEFIMKQFIEQDPGGNGKGKTIGMLCGLDLTGNYDLNYQMDIVFATYNAFPKKWIQQEDGSIVYGSVTEEAKEALGLLQRWYKEGVLDNDFIIRSDNNNHDLIIEGRCGAFFGPWWAPNNPLISSVEHNENANWVPYLIPTNGDGSCTTYMQPASSKFIVVRKGFEHPEIVTKMISVLFDYERFVDKDNKEIQEIYTQNLDPSARPVVVNVDYIDGYFRSSQSISEVLEGNMDLNDLTTLEVSYYKLCDSYMKHESPTPEEWAAYTSRITAANLINDSRIVYMENRFEGQTDTMLSKWWALEKLEQEAYLKIITGSESVDYFDIFVDEWYANGGSTVTKEVNVYTAIKH